MSAHLPIYRWLGPALALLALGAAAPHGARAEAPAAAEAHAAVAPQAVKTTAVMGSAAPRAEVVLTGYAAQALERLRKKGLVMLDGTQNEHPIAALVIFKQPREKTFRLLAQSERQNEYRPEITSIRTIERRPEGPLDEHQLKIMFVKVAYRLQFLLDYEARSLRWTLDPQFDNGLEHVAGVWELYEYSDAQQTLGRFGTAVRVGKGLPRWLQDSVSRSKVPDTLEATRRWVDSSGRWRP